MRKVLHYEKNSGKRFCKNSTTRISKKKKDIKGHARSIKAGCKTNFLMWIKKPRGLTEWNLPSRLKKFLFVCFQNINFKLDFYIPFSLDFYMPIQFGLLNTPFYSNFYINFLFPILISILYPFSIWIIISFL